MWPDVTLQICTYNRPEEIARTVLALREGLVYSGRLHWLVCDDASPGKYLDKLKRSAAFKGLDATFVTIGQNSGWAKNVNNGLRQIKSDYIFFLEDDYVVTGHLDLDAGLALLLTKPHIGMLRYRGTAGDHLVLHQMEADVSAYLPDYREGTGVAGKLTYCLLDSGSPTVWLYSNGPHLKHARFHDFYGFYPEGLRLGETEEKFAHTVKDGMKKAGAPALAITPGWIPMKWEHIGRSFQHTELDQVHET